ncbi:MAG: peptidylprolyl isomerase, partial [Melioribacteraceae bacterium]|nr:peptidylprolyl isomerase [Melioribacteraceae bacterium]
FGLYFSNLIAQTNLGDDEIAKVGWLSISSDEFLERIEMTPQFNRQRDKSNESLKLEFLYTLIAEKLWALEAENMNLDSTTAIKTALSSIEKLYVRDALFNEEVKNKIKVTEDMYIDGVIKNSKVFYVKYLFSDEYSKITSLFNFLQKGESFEELLVKNRQAEEQKEPIEIIFGDLIENIEDELFKLKIGENTKIVAAEDGWYIFKLYDIKDREFDDEEEQVTKYVRKILEQRVGESIQNAFYKEFFQNFKVNIKKDLFFDIENELKNIFQSKMEMKIDSSTNLLSIDAYDVNRLTKNIGKGKLGNVFIEFDVEPIILSKFIEEFFFDGFQIAPSDLNNLSGILSSKIRIFIERELLAREGYKRNLQNKDEVRKSLAMWKDYYLSQAYLSKIVEDIEVKDSEINTYYEKEYSDHESKTYDELKNTIKRAIAFDKAYPEILDNTVSSANGYNIEINAELLNNLKITNINTFAIRIMGFGGKITAVPLQKPFSDWVKKWINKPNILP